MSALIDPEAIGVEVSWSFGNGDADAVQIDRAAVRVLLRQLDFAESYLPDIGEDEALKRALRYAPSRRDVAVKEFARPRKDTPRSLGVYVRNAEDGEAGDTWSCEARVRWSDVAGKRYVLALAPEGRHTITHPRAHNIAHDMASLANLAVTHAANIDISLMLCDIGRDLGWINRRRYAGGVYYLPADTDRSEERAERFVRLLHGLQRLTPGDPKHRFDPQAHDLFPSPMTLQSWSASAEQHFRADLEHLQKELQRMVDDGNMRDKTKQARADEADALIAKADGYRLLLGAAVDQLTASLQQVKSQFAVAIGKTAEEAKVAVDQAMAAFEQIDRSPEPAPKPRRRGRHVSADELFSL